VLHISKTSPTNISTPGDHVPCQSIGGLGNTCRPLVTAGDNKQLAPVVMHQDITDMFGNYLNRLVDEAQL